jgi:hypothetical protein
MYNVLRNVVFYHTRKLLNVEKIKSGYDLKLLSNLKDKTINLQGIKTLKKSHIYSKMMKKKTCHVLGQL